MYIKIYFGDKPVFLCDAVNEELNAILHHPDAVFIDEMSSHAINALLHEIKKEEFHAGVLLNSDLETLKKMFFKHFTIIEAAGGIVQNEKNELLFIYRLGKWDLPKGKLEEDENCEDCAIREVEEETNVRTIQLINKVGETYHTYDAFGKHNLKISHWYKMECNSQQELVPQTTEDITQIKWVTFDDLTEVLSNTYPSIKDILGRYTQQ
ncbi:NUDIX hydrolase [Ferruginibacter albus]|uniref:NUDIX hydrolase n=1 Tax=Ferruginibacter albus TaxID=2875540 RepID=UPI001CC3A93C|nr:NUDIX domain-containing protein [Ferruginibacter albus]UAY51003.1 NUDIX domain-containing protein [Ferruginibacter albus]